MRRVRLHRIGKAALLEALARGSTSAIAGKIVAAAWPGADPFAEVLDHGAVSRRLAGEAPRDEGERRGAARGARAAA
jgi:hypothetical protein